MINLSFEFDPTLNQGSFRNLGTDFSSKIAPSAMILGKIRANLIEKLA